MARMIFAIAAFIAGVARMTVPPVSPETAVFAALLDNIGMGPLPDTLLLGDSTLQFQAPTVANNRSWRAQFDSIPAQLPIRLAEISKTKVATESLALPRPMRVLTGAELREIFSADPTSNWAEFYRRYPKQRSYLRLSPVAFGTDSLDALVYYEFYCGSLCGGGHAVWLSRSTATDSWRVRKKVMFWVS